MTLLIYFSTLIFSIFFAHLATKKIVLGNKLLKVSYINSFVSLLIITLLVGLRNETVGVDTYYYIREYFTNYNEFNFSFFSNYTEPGHSFITYQLNNFQASSTVYLLTFSTLSLFFFFLYYQNDKERLTWSIFFAFCIGYFFMMMNGMRQAVALPIIALSVRYVTNRNPFKFLGVVLIATLFHYSAFLIIPIYFINYLSKVSLKHWLVLFIVSIFITPFSVFYYFRDILILLPKNYEPYFSQVGLSESKFSLGFLYHLLLSFVALYFSSKIKFDKFNKNILVLYFLGIIFMNLTYQFTILQRFNIYFVFFQIPAMSYITYNLKKNNQIPSVALIVVLYLFLFVYKIITGDSGCCPYQSIFN